MNGIGETKQSKDEKLIIPKATNRVKPFFPLLIFSGMSLTYITWIITLSLGWLIVLLASLENEITEC